MACIGHNCTDRRYRANNVKHVSATNDSPDASKKKCEGRENQAYASVEEELAKAVNPDDVETEECPAGEDCKCYGKPEKWPDGWTTLESGVTFTGKYVDVMDNCVYNVTLTYDYECQERSGKCYKKPPTKKGGKKTGAKKKGKAAVGERKQKQKISRKAAAGRSARLGRRPGRVVKRPAPRVPRR